MSLTSSYHSQSIFIFLQKFSRFINKVKNKKLLAGSYRRRQKVLFPYFSLSFYASAIFHQFFLLSHDFELVNERRRFPIIINQYKHQFFIVSYLKRNKLSNLIFSFWKLACKHVNFATNQQRLQNVFCFGSKFNRKNLHNIKCF